jgi:hypothetical protein
VLKTDRAKPWATPPLLTRGGIKPRPCRRAGIGRPNTSTASSSHGGGLLNWPRGCHPRRAPNNKRSLVSVSLYQASPRLGVGLRLGAVFSSGVFAAHDPGRAGGQPLAPGATPPAWPATPEERDPRTAERLPEGRRHQEPRTRLPGPDLPNPPRSRSLRGCAPVSSEHRFGS